MELSSANTFTPVQTGTVSDKMTKLLNEKRAAREMQERKHPDWNDNYELYRNKVKTNRLTQRQPVNIPLMKESIKTILSKIDDVPHVDWKELSGDLMKQVIFQEMWNQFVKEKKIEWLDVLDKKGVLLYALSTTKFNIGAKSIPVEMNVLDPFDVLFDPMMNPLDTETARFIIHQNIFRSLREILADTRYSEAGKNKLKIWSTSPEGIVVSSQNKEEWEKKLERLKAMGLDSNQFAHFAGGDVIVNITEHFTLEWDTKAQKFEKRVVEYADDSIELLDEPLIELLGVEFWPFSMWQEDPETNDIYPDGVADLVRTPNKLVNVWMSQLTENRTLQNFQMHWYLPTQGYTPQTYDPGPGRMLPAPGGTDDVRKVIQPVQINGLDETINAINFLVGITERGTGATAIEKGTPEQGQQTLGEIQILVGNALERATSMQKFYRGSWYEKCKKWAALMHANPPEKITLYKTGRSGKVYPKVLYPKDWMSDAGFEPVVSSTSEQEQSQIKTLQKFNYVLKQFPTNLALKRIAQKRELESLDLTPDELKEVVDGQEEADRLAAEQAGMQMNPQMQATPTPTPQPVPAIPEEDLTEEMSELSQLAGV